MKEMADIRDAVLQDPKVVKLVLRVYLVCSSLHYNVKNNLSEAESVIIEFLSAMFYNWNQFSFHFLKTRFSCDNYYTLGKKRKYKHQTYWENLNQENFGEKICILGRNLNNFSNSWKHAWCYSFILPGPIWLPTKYLWWCKHHTK